MGLRISDSGSDFIEWSWTPVAGASGYDVQFSVDEAFTDADEIIARAVEETSYRRQPLPAGSHASLRVRSALGTGADRVTSAWSMHVIGMSTTVPPPPAPEEEVCADWAELRAGEYLLVNDVWNKGDITDYEQCLMRRVVDGEDQYGWRWQWPYGRGEHKANPRIVYGTTPWWSTTADLPRQISAVERFEVDYELDVTTEGDPKVYVHLSVTSADPPTRENRTHEIRIHVNRSYSGSSSGDVNISGVAFDLWVEPQSASTPGDPRWISFESRTPELSGTLKLHEFLDYLVDHGHLPAGNYVNTVQLGTELTSGSGEFWIKGFDVSVDTAAPPEPPVAPSGLHVSWRDEDVIQWSWDAVAGADGYDVQFGTDEMFTDGETGSTTIPEYRKEGLDPGTTGYLRVRSVAGAGAGRLVSAWTIPIVGVSFLPPPPNDLTPAPMDPTPTPLAEETCERWETMRDGEYHYRNGVWVEENTTTYEQCVMRRVVDGRDEYGWRWRWPAPSDRSRAFPHVRFGWSPWDSRSTTPRLPDQISYLRNLDVDYEAYMTATGVYRTVFGTWLTREYPPTLEAVTTRIKIWVDWEWDWDWGSEDLIDHADIDGATFAVYVRPDLRPDQVSGDIPLMTHVDFVSHTDRFGGTLDLKQFLDYLVDRQIVSGDDIVNDIQFGNEVKRGTGELWLKRFDVTVR